MAFRLAAYFHDGPRTRGFICAGTLIHSKAVLTAAHCIQQKNESFARKAEDATIHIGQHNSDGIGDGQMSSVEKFILSPEWDHRSDNYDADIAFVILSQVVQFSQFVRRICLTLSLSTYYDLIGKTGVVAGALLEILVFKLFILNFVFIKGWKSATERTTFLENYDEVFVKEEFSPTRFDIRVTNELNCVRSQKSIRNSTGDRLFCAKSNERDRKSGPCFKASG